jgi:hypothetical protein
MLRRNIVVSLCLLLCLPGCLTPVVNAQTPTPGATPLLLTEEGTDRAIALEAVTRVRIGPGAVLPDLGINASLRGKRVLPPSKRFMSR